MIRINLLPNHLRPIRHNPLPYVFSVLLFIVGVGAMGMLYVQKEAEIRTDRRILERHKAELADLAPIIEESQSLVQLRAELAEKIDTIAEITRDRIIWSRQLYNISRLSPSNVWYRSITITDKPVQERQQVYDARTRETRTQTVTVRKPLLRLEGYVTEADDGTQNVNRLMQAMESDPEFSRRFELEPPSFRDTEFAGYPVRSFTLEFMLVTPEEIQR